MNFDSITVARALTALTLSFHIIFATLGVGVPVMISFAEWMGIKRKDPHYILLARRWTRGFAVIVTVSIVTGMCLGLQLSLLWPSFMQIVDQAIGLPLFLEVIAFFFESILLGIYLYTWDRYKKPMFHWFLSISIIISSSLAAFFITTINAFMNTPQGFRLVDGKMVDLQPLVAMVNPAMPTKTFHVIVTSYLTSALILASITAAMMLGGRKNVYYQKALKLTMTSAFLFSISSAAAGDLSTKFLAKYQPEKLAAGQWHFETEKEADLILFGVLDKKTEKITYEIRIPGALSYLLFYHAQSEVQGLNETKDDVRPPLYLHYIFDIKIVFTMFIVLISFLYVIILKYKYQGVMNHYLLRGILLAGPLALVTTEMGWFFSEMGRQPWMLRGYMKVSEAVTTAPSIQMNQIFVFFSILYVFLAAISIYVLMKMFHTSPAELDREKSIEYEVI
ncbi:cytochrome ubiquinol oxidase subunit I [Ectobacillus sp. sgz5001026]|uniref:cytochrome ubiquinol oxidase subunit I n=1 Tax=Ectobacillus sp. sgz5001026 TaxID=3242473 RepID=UPI0036D38CCF